MLFFSVGRGSTERLVRYHWRPETVHPIVLVPEIHSVMWGSGLHMKYLTGQTSYKHQFSSVQWLSRVQLFGTPWTAARQASLSITNSRSLPKLMSIESMMPSNHLILCCALLLPSIFPSIRVFSNESALRFRWPKYWSFSSNISPSNEYQDWSPLGWTGWISVPSKCL